MTDTFRIDTVSAPVRAVRGLLVVALMVALTACSQGSDGTTSSGNAGDAGGTSTGDGGGTSTLDEETVAYKLAAVGGSLGDEAAFQAVLDCIMASGIKGAETEMKVADTLYASWAASSQAETLLEWGQAFC